MKVAIFGSCVTRDLFEDVALRPTVASYAARSSVISAVAPVLKIDEELVVLGSDWQRRCVLADFQKTFFASLRASRADWLVIDLIDERFDLLMSGESYVTRSSAFETAGLSSVHDFGFQPVSQMSSDASGLFEQAAFRFADRVKEMLPAHHVVLHRALWSTVYRSDGRIRPFVDDRLRQCERHNATLTARYDVLARAFGGQARNIVPDLELRVANASHRWGLEPFHYDDAYNAYVAGRLRAVFGLA